MYEPKCSVCKSEYKELIEDKYHAGMTANAIERWLQETYGIKIDHKSIKNHMEKHFNIQEMVRKEYINSESSDPEERMKAYVKEELDELNELNEIIWQSKTLRDLAFRNLQNESKPRLIEVWNATWSSASREAIRAMKMKMEKLGTSSYKEAEVAHRQFVNVILGQIEAEDIYGNDGEE